MAENIGGHHDDVGGQAGVDPLFGGDEGHVARGAHGVDTHRRTDEAVSLITAVSGVEGISSMKRLRVWFMS